MVKGEGEDGGGLLEALRPFFESIITANLGLIDRSTSNLVYYIKKWMEKGIQIITDNFLYIFSTVPRFKADLLSNTSAHPVSPTFIFPARYFVTYLH